MRITTRDIGHYAGKLLEVLEREQISSDERLAAITERGAQKFPAENRGVVVIELLPSGQGTFADTISYIVQGKGIPLEVKRNRALNYALFIVKCGQIIPGYFRFAHDPLGNIVQENTQIGMPFPQVLEHLAELKRYGED